MIIRGSLRTVLPIVVVLVGLGACSNDSAPPRQTSTVTVTPTVTSTSPSASPTPSLPAAAQQPTRAGAEAFARYFFEIYNYAFCNADPAPLQAISAAECVYCKSTLDRVRSMREEQARAEGGLITVTTAVAAPGEPGDGLIVNLVLDQETGRTLSPAGEVVGTTPAVKNGRVDIGVRWESGRWILLDAHVLKDGER